MLPSASSPAVLETTGNLPTWWSWSRGSFLLFRSSSSFFSFKMSQEGEFPALTRIVQSPEDKSWLSFWFAISPFGLFIPLKFRKLKNLQFKLNFLATSPGSSYRNWRSHSVSFSGFTAQWLWLRSGRILTKQSWSIRLYRTAVLCCKSIERLVMVIWSISGKYSFPQPFLPSFKRKILCQFRWHSQYVLKKTIFFKPIYVELWN